MPFMPGYRLGPHGLIFDIAAPRTEGSVTAHGSDKLTVPETLVMATSFICIIVDPKPLEFYMKAPVSMTEEIFALLHNDDGSWYGKDDHC